MQSRLIAASVAAFVSLLISVVRAAPPEVRGTWLTTTANDAISTPAKTAETMRRLREIGLNTVYIECWKNGFTEFPSDTMNKLIGVPMKINAAPPELQRDLLQEAVIEAHRNGLLAIAWFEYGFMAANKTTNNPLRALGEKEGWLLRDLNGNLVSPGENFVWMNPLHPKPQEILLNIVLDAAKKYDLDGVQLDDRIAMPTELGYDDYTRTLYAKDHHGHQPPSDAQNAEWIAWRAARLTDFAKHFSTAVHAVNPNLIVSVSPAPYPWCYQNFACNWPEWMKWTGDARWDECVPQNYRLDFDRTRQSVDEGLKVIGDRRSNLLAGIRIVGDGPDMSAEDLIKSIQFTRDAKLGGHVLWFSRGVLEVYSKQLQAFYNVSETGSAPYPARSFDWRRPAIEAHRLDSGKWGFSANADGRYRVLIRTNGEWHLGHLVETSGKAGEVPESAAEAIELIADHTP